MKQNPKHIKAHSQFLSHEPHAHISHVRDLSNARLSLTRWRVVCELPNLKICRERLAIVSAHFTILFQTHPCFYFISYTDPLNLKNMQFGHQIFIEALIVQLFGAYDFSFNWIPSLLRRPE